MKLQQVIISVQEDKQKFMNYLLVNIKQKNYGITISFRLSMNYRDFSVKSKLIFSLFQIVKLSLSISLFQKIEFS